MCIHKATCLSCLLLIPLVISMKNYFFPHLTPRNLLYPSPFQLLTHLDRIRHQWLITVSRFGVKTSRLWYDNFNMQLKQSQGDCVQMCGFKNDMSLHCGSTRQSIFAWFVLYLWNFSKTLFISLQQRAMFTLLPI